MEGATFHEEVARTLVDYVADRFNRSGAGLTYDTADELLRSRGIEPEVCRAFRGLLERCDFARFVPSSAEPGRQGELLDEAEQILDTLERSL